LKEQFQVSETVKPPEHPAKGPKVQGEPESRISRIAWKIIQSPVKVMVGISSVLLMVIVFLVTADVIGRYIFKHPINGSDELAGLLLLCVAACAFSYTQTKNQHIRIDIFIKTLPKKARLVLDMFNFLVTLVVTALISWQVFAAASRIILNLQGGSKVSEQLHIPWLPILIILGLGFAIYALVILASAVMALTKAGK
jgi:TRAP-type transport system small permease protein